MHQPRRKRKSRRKEMPTTHASPNLLSRFQIFTLPLRLPLVGGIIDDCGRLNLPEERTQHPKEQTKHDPTKT
jgi:hypothetical protein